MKLHNVRLPAGRTLPLAATRDGHLYAWGDNSVGELGTLNSSQAPSGGIDSTNTPMLVPSFFAFLARIVSKLRK